MIKFASAILNAKDVHIKIIEGRYKSGDSIESAAEWGLPLLHVCKLRQKEEEIYNETLVQC